MSNKPSIRRPWRGSRNPAYSGAPAEVYPRHEEPHITLFIYDDQTIFMRRKTERGVAEYPIDPRDLQRTLARNPESSGILPTNTIAYGLYEGSPYYIVYLPPEKVTITWAPNKKRMYTILTPPMVAAFHKEIKNTRLFALNTCGFPQDPRMVLYNIPFSNTYMNGSICWGTTELPKQANVKEIMGAYYGSEFTGHINIKQSKNYPTIEHVYKTINGGETPYPLDDLVETKYTLANLISGEIFGRTGSTIF